jgi:iron complex transport system substrate-binding protein
VLGRPEDGARLADAAASIFAGVDAVLTKVPEAERPRVYLARGPDGLETGLRGSINTEIIERVGAVNVADAPGQRGIANVSPEQVLLWDPEVVVTWDEAFFEAVRTIPFWQNVQAVRENRVYLSPAEPFGWIDRPPSLNRLLGMKWLLKVLYPDEAPFDLRAATRDFYREFYHVDLGPEQLDALLAGSGG